MTRDHSPLEARWEGPAPRPGDEEAISFGEAREMLDILRRMLAGRVPRRGMAVYQTLFVEERSQSETARLLELDPDTVELWRDTIQSHLRQISTQLQLCVRSGWPYTEAGPESA